MLVHFLLFIGVRPRGLLRSKLFPGNKKGKPKLEYQKKNNLIRIHKVLKNINNLSFDNFAFDIAHLTAMLHAFIFVKNSKFKLLSRYKEYFILQKYIFLQ